MDRLKRTAGADIGYREAIEVLGAAAAGELEPLDALKSAWTYAFTLREETVETGAEAQALPPTAETSAPWPKPEKKGEGEDPGKAREDPQPAGEEKPDPYASLPFPANVSRETPELGLETARPVTGAIATPFGYRERAESGTVSFHYGVDLETREGEAAAAFADGTVLLTGESAVFGTYAVLTHENGIRTLYAHLGELYVLSGDSVSRGEPVGTVDGGAGVLHFELMADGAYLDPAGYLA